MEIRYFANNASTTLVSDGGSTITVSSTALFPSQYPFYVTLENTSLTKEIVKVTGLASTGIWNVIRAQEGTVQTTFAAGSKVEQRITAGTLNSIITDKAELSGATFTGDVVNRANGSSGSVKLTSGTTTNTGYIAFFAPDGVTRTGYVGYGDSSILKFVTENNRNIQYDLNGYVNAFSMNYTSGSLPMLKIDGRDVPRRYASGAPLPTVNIGPIWHDDYNQWMTWQIFNANGAAYTGYATINVGQLIPDGQPSQRTGRLRSGGYYSKTAYAAIWNWALHNGLVVALGSWTQGMWAFADNGDGTFRTPDIRGEFMRIYDDSRGVDTARTAFTQWQNWQLANHSHTTPMSIQAGTYATGSPWYVTATSTAAGVTGSTGGTTNNSENRVRNFAQYGSIQF